MEYVKLIIKGFFIGLANIIPGVSGGTLAITLGIYEKLISCISHIFKNLFDNLKFLFPIVIGAGLSILSLSKVISFSIENYVLPTVLFFIGTIIGGVPMLFKKINGKKISVSNIITFVVSFLVIIILMICNGENEVSFENLSIINCISLFFVGLIASATMVIPGVSGSAVLMTLGYYKPILDIIKNITDFNNLGSNLMVLIPFGLGVVIGIVLIAKLLEFLFKNYEKNTYYAVFGFIFSSIISIFYQNLVINSNFVFSFSGIFLGIVFFLLGFVVAYKLGDK